MLRNIAFWIFLVAQSALASETMCPRVEGLQLITERVPKLIFIGEWHGTEEMPAATFSLACHLLASGKKVHLSLEFNTDWSASLQAATRSTAENAQAFSDLATRWNTLRKFPDGRSSEAMWRLLERLALLPASSRERLRMSAFDTRIWEARFPGENQYQDAGMAAALVREVESGSDEITIAFTGELHARLTPNTVSFKPRPIAYLVSIARPKWQLLSLKAQAEGGTF
jgi:hypothetical protein